MTDADIINGILDREQEGESPYLLAGDTGGRTSWGISEHAHPDAWKTGAPTKEAAYEIYQQCYVDPFDFISTCGLDDRLRVNLVDFAVQSGVSTAIKALQGTLDVVADGIVGSETLSALMHATAYVRHINNELLVERLVRDAMAIHTQSQHAFAYNWMERLAMFYWHK